MAGVAVAGALSRVLQTPSGRTRPAAFTFQVPALPPALQPIAQDPTPSASSTRAVCWSRCTRIEPVAGLPEAARPA